MLSLLLLTNEIDYKVRVVVGMNECGWVRRERKRKTGRVHRAKDLYKQIPNLG
jgi:hypothetical protein